MLVTFQKSVLCVFSRGYILTVISRIICGVYSDKGLCLCPGCVPITPSAVMHVEHLNYSAR